MSIKKTTDLDKPHATFESGGWTWRVLKVYSTAAKSKNDSHARWFCAVQSPMTFGGWEYGDTYRAEVERFGRLTQSTQAFDAYLA